MFMAQDVNITIYAITITIKRILGTDDSEEEDSDSS